MMQEILLKIERKQQIINELSVDVRVNKKNVRALQSIKMHREELKKLRNEFKRLVKMIRG
jgi:hypothetical protein